MRIAACLLALLVSGAPLVAAGAPALSREQQRRLQGGEVVVLDVLPPGGDVKGSQGGTALAVVHAPSERVWQVLVDYGRHAGLYPRVVGATILELDPARALVRYVVGVGPFSFGFHVNNYPDPARGRLVWRLALDRRNELFQDSWGYWQIEPDTRGVLLTYAMAARMVLPAFLTRGAERDGLVETVRAVRGRAEGE
jgi:hypothetical protein